LKAAGDEVEVTGTGDEAGKAVASSVVPGLKMAGSGTPGAPGSNLNADGSVKTTVDAGKGVAGAAKPLDGAKGDTNVVPKPGANPVTAAGDKSVVPPINSSQLALLLAVLPLVRAPTQLQLWLLAKKRSTLLTLVRRLSPMLKKVHSIISRIQLLHVAAAAAGGAAAAVVATNAANAMKTPGVTPPAQVTTDATGKVVGTSGTPGNTGANPTGNVPAANLTGQTGVSTGVQPNPGVTPAATSNVTGEEIINADPAAQALAAGKEGTATLKPGGNPVVNAAATAAAATAAGVVAGQGIKAQTGAQTPTPPAATTTDVNGRVVSSGATPNAAQAGVVNPTLASTGGIVPPMANAGVTPAATSNVTGEEIINADPAAQALAAGKEGTATLKPGGNPVVNAAATAAAATAAGVVAGQGIKAQTGAQTPTPPAATTTDVNGRVVSSGATPNAAQAGVVNPTLASTGGIVPPMANAGVTPAATSNVTGEEIINADPAAQALAAGKEGTATLKPGGNPVVNAAATAAAATAAGVVAGQGIKTQTGAQTPTPPAATTDVNGRVVSSGATPNAAQPGVVNPNMQNITPTSGLVPPMATANTGANPLVNAELVEEAAVAGAAGAAGAAALGTVRPTGAVNPSSNTARVDGVNTTGTVTGRVIPPVSGQAGAAVNQGTVNVTPGATRVGHSTCCYPNSVYNHSWWHRWCSSC
jgi:hypothetical protein